LGIGDLGVGGWGATAPGHKPQPQPQNAKQNNNNFKNIIIFF